MQWLKTAILRMGRIHLDCIESTICGLTAQRKIAFKEGASLISHVNELRTGNRTAKDESPIDDVIHWSEGIEILSITVESVSGRAMHKHSKLRNVS